MSGMLGAIKGVSRGLILVVLGVLIPGLAWVVASYAESSFGMGFKTAFFGTIGLGVFLGICALFGVASEVQEDHSAAMDRAIEQGDGDG
jgi:hypothetical protein